jgi:hypothetical protein
MGNIKQFGHKNLPQWSQWQGTGNDFLDLLLVVVGIPAWLAIMVLCVISTVTAAYFTIGAFSSIIKLIAHGAPSYVLQNIVSSALEGIFAGITIATVRSWGRKPGNIEKSFLSALFTKGLELPPYNKVFWGRVFVGGVLGMVTGSVAGATGALSFPQLLSGTAHEVLMGTGYLVSEYVSGLTGGAGAGGGFDYWFSLAILAIALILMGLFLGVISGFAVHIIMSSIAGLVKGASKEFIIAVLEEKNKDSSNNNSHPLIAGMVRGLLTGFMAGVLMSVSTIWGIVRFF